MLTGETPFLKYCTSEDSLFNAIISKEPNLKSPYLSTPARDLLSKLLHKNPKKRLRDPLIIKTHPFFRDIDWDKLVQKSLVPPYVPIVANY
jgi:serine/threonine protein kinase